MTIKKTAVYVLIILITTMNIGCGGGSDSSSSVVSVNLRGGATALCNDGTLSYSKHAQGTCSQHGGVKEWLNSPRN